MSSELIAGFKEYCKKIMITRVRMSSVPEEFKPLVLAYRKSLSSQLNDPENESWDSLGPNEHSKAMQTVCIDFGPKVERPRGNCPRCAGTGTILAFSHVRGGECLQCHGTGGVVLAPLHSCQAVAGCN